MANQSKSDLSETNQAGQDERKGEQVTGGQGTEVQGGEGGGGEGGGQQEERRPRAGRGRRRQQQQQQESPDPIEEIRGLILLDLAAVQAYQFSIEACSIREIVQQLESFRADHERHVQELSEALRRLGAEPPEGLDTRGLCIAGYTELTAVEDRSALVAVRGNEELTNEAYTSALAAELPEEFRRLVMANWQDEHRHIRWVNEELRIRGWLMPEVPPELASEVMQQAA